MDFTLEFIRRYTDCLVENEDGVHSCAICDQGCETHGIPQHSKGVLHFSKEPKPGYTLIEVVVTITDGELDRKVIVDGIVFDGMYSYLLYQLSGHNFTNDRDISFNYYMKVEIQ